MLALHGCSCEEDPAGLGKDAGSTEQDSGLAMTPDTGFDDAGNPIPFDSGPYDGGFDDAGNPIPPPDATILTDGGTDSDSGDPLEQPLSEFCTGNGTVVTVGGASLCAGDVAAETFQFALCACETIEVQSTLSIDAFDSRVGAYGASNVLDDGQMGVNDQLSMEGKLSVRGSVYVGGPGFSVGSQSLITRNLYSGGIATQANSSSSINRNAYVNGDVSGRYQIGGDLYVPASATIDPGTTAASVIRRPIPALSPCPCDPGQILDIPALTRWAETHNDNAVDRVVTSTAWENGTGPSTLTLPCGRYWISSIRHPSTLTLRAEGRTVLFVDGDMIIDGGMNLEIGPEGEVDLFVAGSLAVGAAASFGDTSRPSLVRTYVGGSENVSLSASAAFGGNLYAPRALVDFGASAKLYGAVFVRRGSFSGAAEVHFDTAIRSAGESCDQPAPGTDGGALDSGPYDGGFDDAGQPIPAPDATVDGSTQDAAPLDTGLPTDAGARDGAPDGSVGDASAGDAAPDASAPDASAPDASGPIACAACGECEAPLGCVIPPAQTAGVCGACVFDLDCCPPYSCVAGVCMIQQ